MLLDNAPLDDEPVTPEEEAAVQIAREEIARGETISPEEVRGVHSQGRTRAQARENVIDALQTMLTRDEALDASAQTEPLIFTTA